MTIEITSLDYQQAKREFQREFLRQSLKRNGWNQVKASNEMHIHRNTTNRILYDLGILPLAK